MFASPKAKTHIMAKNGIFDQILGKMGLFFMPQLKNSMLPCIKFLIFLNKML